MKTLFTVSVKWITWHGALLFAMPSDKPLNRASNDYAQRENEHGSQSPVDDDSIQPRIICLAMSKVILLLVSCVRAKDAKCQG